MGDHRCASTCLLGLGSAAIARHDDEAAVAPLREAAALAQRMTFAVVVAAALHHLAGIDERAGDHEQSARLLGRASVAADRLDPPRRSGLPDVDQLRGRLAIRLGDRAAALVQAGRDVAPGFPW
jgi:hypothetical protein